MGYDTQKIRKYFESLSSEKIAEFNQKNDDEHERNAKAFVEGYEKGFCYLCNKPFKTVSNNNPCVHWLLRRCKFKKKDFPKIYNRYGYGNIAAFLRWCANQERLLSNINDLENEKSDRKILSYTIKWKNIEWTFDCSKTDFKGHFGTKTDFPHYHFQMRIDGKQFINFGDFHVPFTDEDQFILSLKEEQGDCFKQNFGHIGAGMQDAMSIDSELLLEHMISSDKENATYNLSTIVEAKDKPISGELIYEAQEESKKTGISMAAILSERLAGVANVQTVISPADSIPDIATRSERKRR